MVVHAEVDPQAGPVICPYPPTPQNSLFFYIDDPIKVQQDGREDFILQPRSVIVGPQLTRVSIDINRSHKAVRVGFHPGGLFRFLGFPLHEMVDGSFDAADVFGQELKQLNEQLQEAKNFEEIRHLVESFLLLKRSKLRQSLPFDLAMLELVKQQGSISMEALASMACLSLRQFERVSKERIGLPPKLFARLVRFSKAYRLREQFPEKSWTSIAHESGYFDQVHFTRDFREFAGVRPGIIQKQLEALPVRMQASLQL